MQNSIADIQLNTINTMEFTFEKDCISGIRLEFVTGCIADAYYANQSIETILRIIMRDVTAQWLDNALLMQHFANIELRNTLLKKVYYSLAEKQIPDQVITSENGFFQSMRFHDIDDTDDIQVYLIAIERLKSKQLNCYDALVKIASTVKQCDLTKFTTLLFLLEKQAVDDIVIFLQAAVKSLDSGLYFNSRIWMNRLSELQVTILHD